LEPTLRPSAPATAQASIQNNSGLPPHPQIDRTLLCAVILIGFALAGSLQQLRGTRAPVAIVAK
jgi:hypothetical protein